MAVCSMAFLLGTTGAFSVSMQYQPPVKSSVNKLSNPRMPRPSGSSPSASSSASSSSHPDNRQASRKQAFASIYAPEAPTASFEQRMRQLALGTQAKTSSTSSLGRDNCAIRPRNVHVIESLADYKKIVGEEKEKVVAVRFHATWCRVSYSIGVKRCEAGRYQPDVLLTIIHNLFLLTSGMQSCRSALLPSSSRAQRHCLCRCTCYPRQCCHSQGIGRAKPSLWTHLPSSTRSRRRVEADPKGFPRVQVCLAQDEREFQSIRAITVCLSVSHTQHHGVFGFLVHKYIHTNITRTMYSSDCYRSWLPPDGPCPDYSLSNKEQAYSSVITTS